MTERQRAFIPVWQEIRDATIRILERYTIQSIADSVPEIVGDDFKPIYQI
jgi:DNA-binding IscR family transcriptional regulator